MKNYLLKKVGHGKATSPFIILLCALFLASPLLVNAQGRTIQGTVTSMLDGTSLPGVNVLIKGTTSGTVTDVDGKYSINADDTDVLVFSFVGFTSEEVAVSDIGGNTFDISLAEDIEALGEVVVIGYGTVKKSDLTGAVAKVDVDKMKQLSTIDPLKAMQGRVSGVNITSNSGAPGAGAKVRIRGIGSLNGSDPLYIIDGFPAGDISSVSPNDIESIEVLKDASATAIYGARGANGVILVTTRSGRKEQAAVITFNAYAGIAQLQKKLDLLNATEWATLYLESNTNSGQTPGAQLGAIANYVKDNNYKGTDWQDQLFQTGAVQSYYLSVSGGTEKHVYDIAGTFASEEGIVDYSKMDKYIFRFNNDLEIRKNVNIGANLAYTHFKRTGTSGMPDIYVNPIAPAWDSQLDNWGAKIFAAGQNPAQALHESRNNWSDGNRMIGNFYLDVKDIIIPGLSFRSQYGISKNFGHYKSYYPKYTTNDVQNQRLQSDLNEGRSENQSWTFTNYFSYLKDINKSSINATLGVEAQAYEGADLSGTRYEVPADPNLWYMNESINIEDFRLNGGGSHSSLMSGFARVNYSYDSRYLLTATGRVDGSSKFKKEQRWGFFPSFSAGWNIHNENFFTDIPVVTQLKLRAGWGQVGNDAGAGNNDYVAVVEKGYNYVFGDQIVGGATQRQFSNTEIQWEISQQLNIGLDFGLFKNTLTGTVDYFIRDTRDMVIPNPVPMYAGLGRPNVNVGTMQNKGIELALNYNRTTPGGFSYDFNFNISHIENKVTGLDKLDAIPGGDIYRLGYTTITKEGQELATFWGLKTEGIFQSQEEVDAYVYEGVKIQPNAVAGDVKFIDKNGDGKIDDEDNYILGSGWADFTAGFNANIAYKGFDFNVFLQGTYGNELVNGQILTLHSTVVNEQNVSRKMLDRYPFGDMPRISNNDDNNNRRFSDRYVEDGSYLRIKNVQLGYTLPEGVMERLKVSRLRIYVSAENLKTFSNYSGLDPEVYANFGNALNYGVDNGTYPVPRVITGGINITF